MKFLFLLLFQLGISQSIVLNYTFKSNQPSNPIFSNTQYCEMIINNKQSIFKLNKDSLDYNFPIEEKITKEEVIQEKLSDNHYKITTKENLMIYKDYEKDSIYLNNTIINKMVYIKEKLNLFQWKLLNKDTILMKLPCKMATTEFRGKKWIVAYTDKLTFNGGPWKLDGLPGMILFAKTTDNKFIIETIKYKQMNTNISIPFPFDGKFFYSWEDYKTNLKKTYVNLIKKMKSEDEDGGDVSIKLNDLIEEVGFTELK